MTIKSKSSRVEASGVQNNSKDSQCKNRSNQLSVIIELSDDDRVSAMMLFAYQAAKVITAMLTPLLDDEVKAKIDLDVDECIN